MSKTNLLPVKWMFEQFKTSDGTGKYEHQPITIRYDWDIDALVIERKTVIKMDNIGDFLDTLGEIALQIGEEKNE